MDNHNGLSARPCQSLYARDGVVEKTTDVCCAMKAVVFPQGIRVAVTPATAAEQSRECAAAIN